MTIFVLSLACLFSSWMAFILYAVPGNMGRFRMWSTPPWLCMMYETWLRRNVLQFSSLLRLFFKTQSVEVDFVTNVDFDGSIVNDVFLVIDAFSFCLKFGVMFFPRSRSGQQRIPVHFRFAFRRARHVDRPTDWLTELLDIWRETRRDDSDDAESSREPIEWCDQRRWYVSLSVFPFLDDRESRCLLKQFLFSLRFSFHQI